MSVRCPPPAVWRGDCRAQRGGQGHMMVSSNLMFQRLHPFCTVVTNSTHLVAQNNGDLFFLSFLVSRVKSTCQVSAGSHSLRRLRGRIHPLSLVAAGVPRVVVPGIPVLQASISKSRSVPPPQFLLCVSSSRFSLPLSYKDP